MCVFFHDTATLLVNLKGLHQLCQLLRRSDLVALHLVHEIRRRHVKERRQLEKVARDSLFIWLLVAYIKAG